MKKQYADATLTVKVPETEAGHCCLPGILPCGRQQFYQGGIQMTDLQECRRQIDEIDSEILRLFEKRMKVSEDVANYKIST